MDLHYKPSGIITMCDFMAHEELYEAAIRVGSNRALIAQTKAVGLYHRRLHHASYVALRESVEHVQAVKRTNLKDLSECKACKLGKSTRVLRTAA